MWQNFIDHTKVETLTIGEIYAFLKHEAVQVAYFDCFATIDDADHKGWWYCDEISVYEATFVLLGPEPNRELMGANHEMPAPQCLVDTFGQTHKFRKSNLTQLMKQHMLLECNSILPWMEPAAQGLQLSQVHPSRRVTCRRQIDKTKSDKSSEKGDSEFKTNLECIKKAFPTKSDSWRIVTQGEVKRQPSPTRTIKLFSIASSGPVQTAPQDNKPVNKLKQSLGKRPEKTSPFIERRHGCKVLFSVEEEVETVSKHGVSTETIFIKERYNNNRITKTLMNPSEILKLFTQTHTSEVNRIGQAHKLSTLGLETTIRFTGDGEYLGDTPKVEMGGEETGTSNGGDGCSPEQAVETQQIFSETQRRLPNRYTFKMNKVVADRGALKLHRHRDFSPESLVNDGIPTTQAFKMPETMDEGRDCDGRRSGIR
ncbi:hypothetical protein HID58_076337 [Brassica napus]|uniref:Uncharacterized protein n=1 Tax=Brassica napus TaxID=3708 RepID=A0ABQ7YM68_BRANA|nr:hypothetical protein HID58_076337 [Brassica napus]